MVAEVLERGFGDGEVSPAADAAARVWAGFTVRAVEAPAGLPHPDVLLPGRAARETLFALGDDLARWALEARTERTYWETGGPPGGGHLADGRRVRVTASGWADASAWRLRGGLSGIDQGMFAQGGAGDGIAPGALLGVLLEQAVTGSPEFGSVAGLSAAGTEPEWMALRREQAAERGEPGPAREPDQEAAAAAEASREAGPEPLAGIPGIEGASGVRTLTADELLGSMAAAQRMANRSEWARLATIAEFARRRYAETQAAIDSGRPAGQRAGEFFCEEVSWASCESARHAEEQIELAVSMAVRLPCLGGRMAEGALDSKRLLIVHRATAELPTPLARLVDALLAPDAPGLTPEALRKRAWRLVLKLAPDVMGKRRKKGKRARRVEMWMEDSGNAGLAGRELDPEEALAANSYYDEVARALRAAGVEGTLRELRHLAFVDSNTGRNPLDRIGTGGETRPDAPENGLDASEAGAAASGSGRDDGLDASGGPNAEPEPGTPADAPRAEDEALSPEEFRDDGYREDEPATDGLDAYLDDDGERDEDEDGDYEERARARHEASKASSASGAAANIHLLVPAGTVLGWSPEPADVTGLGPVDASTARDLVKSAARNPATRWHVTLVDEESGEAVAHACARGRHDWPGPEGPADGGGSGGISGFGGSGGSGGSVQTVRDGDGSQAPDRDEQARQVAGLLSRLGVTEFETIAKGDCDHAHREDRYVPSRKLGDLVRARTAKCPAPCCGSGAVRNDLDHTRAYPEEPGTCECNLAPPCRRHHRVKQAPGWLLEQVSPGEMRWTTPSGRVYETHPTIYDV